MLEKLKNVEWRDQREAARREIETYQSYSSSMISFAAPRLKAAAARANDPTVGSALLKDGKHLAYLKAEEFARMLEAQKSAPQRIGEIKADTLWMFQGHVYQADGDLDAADVAALAAESENRRRLRLERAHALAAMRQSLDNNARRQKIPQEVRVAVWQRDGGRCVECGSQEELEFDHIIPRVMGGGDTERNLQLLCGPCNRRKGGTLG